MSAVYLVGSNQPDLAIIWKDSDGEVIDFSEDWTFTVKVGRRPFGANALAVPKTTGIVGSATAPNVVITWDDGEIGALPSGSYVVQVEAASDGRTRQMQGPIEIKPRIA